MSFNNPGSLEEFAKSRMNQSPGKINWEETFADYSEELKRYRNFLVKAAGISVDDLHNYPNGVQQGLFKPEQPTLWEQ